MPIALQVYVSNSMGSRLQRQAMSLNCKFSPQFLLFNESFKNGIECSEKCQTTQLPIVYCICTILMTLSPLKIGSNVKPRFFISNRCNFEEFTDVVNVLSLPLHTIILCSVLSMMAGHPTLTKCHRMTPPSMNECSATAISRAYTSSNC